MIWNRNLLKKKWRDILMLSFILLIVSLFFLPLFYPYQRIFLTPDFGQSDLWQLNYPLKYSLSVALKNNSLPLWNSIIGTGFPQLAEGQTGVFNVINLILFRFLPFVAAINLGYVSIFAMTSISVFLCLRFLNRSIPASFLSAVLFGFAGFFIVHISHFNLIQAASFLPLVFLLTHLYIKKKDHLLTLICLLALVLSQQYFSGFPQISFITLCGVFGLIIFSLIRKELSAKKVLIFAGAIMIFLSLSAIQFLPSYELLKLSNRKGGFLLNQASYFSYPPAHFKTLLNPYALGDPRKGSYPFFADFDGSVFWENTGYIGIIPLVLAAFSLFSIKKRKTVQFYFLLMVGSALLMMGKYSPLYFIYSFPPFSLFRVPSRFILLFIWAICVLAAFGFDMLLSLFKKKGIKTILITCLTLIIGAFSFWQILSFASTYNPKENAASWLKPPQTAAFLQKQKDIRYFTIGSPDKWNEVVFHKGWTQTEPFHVLQNDLVPNQNLLYGLPSYQVYPILLTRRYQLGMTLLEQNLFSQSDNSQVSENGKKLLSLNAVTHIISSRVIKNLKQVYTIDSKDKNAPHYYIYQINTVPYAHIVYDYKIADTVEAIQNQFLERNFDENKQVILEKKPTDFVPTTNTHKSKVHYGKKNGEIMINVDTNTKAILVVAESYYPGWKAFLDGKSEEIYPANLNQMSIIIPSGKHVIRFVYEPSSFLHGAIISLISYLIIILLMVSPVSFFPLRFFASKDGLFSRS